MPAYIGSKKVKELYYGGKKIKEAWYGGKKVFSSAVEVWPWASGLEYQKGDLVSRDGFVYECIRDHTSDSGTSQPGSGWDEYSYWKNVGYTYEFDNLRFFPWKQGEYYIPNSKVEAVVNGRNSVFLCLEWHQSTERNRPGGPEGGKYWQEQG